MFLRSHSFPIIFSHGVFLSKVSNIAPEVTVTYRNIVMKFSFFNEFVSLTYLRVKNLLYRKCHIMWTNWLSKVVNYVNKLLQQSAVNRTVVPLSIVNWLGFWLNTYKRMSMSIDIFFENFTSIFLTINIENIITFSNLILVILSRLYLFFFPVFLFSIFIALFYCHNLCMNRWTLNIWNMHWIRKSYVIRNSFRFCWF